MNKWEWFELIRELRPNLSEAEYERMWARFVAARELWQRRN